LVDPKEQFLSAVRAERQAVLDAIGGVDDQTLTTRPVCGVWTAREVLAHLAAVDAVALQVLNQARAGENLTWPWDSYDGDDWNGNEVAKRAGLSVDEILAEIRSTHRRVVAELESWPSGAGPFGPDSWDPEKCPIGWLASHDKDHANALSALRAGV